MSISWGGEWTWKRGESGQRMTLVGGWPWSVWSIDFKLHASLLICVCLVWRICMTPCVFLTCTYVLCVLLDSKHCLPRISRGWYCVSVWTCIRRADSRKLAISRERFSLSITRNCFCTLHFDFVNHLNIKICVRIVLRCSSLSMPIFCRVTCKHKRECVWMYQWVYTCTSV